MQQEYLAKLQLLAISAINRALNNCRKVLDHSRKIGLPVAFIRMLNESAFFNRATPCDASASHAHDDVSAGEIHRAVSKISGLYGEVNETTEWIDATLPRKLGIGKNAGG
jgi:hypothetical protein